jgi:hypothetical protein
MTTAAPDASAAASASAGAAAGGARASGGDTSPPPPAGTAEAARRSDLRLALVAAVVSLPILWMGYGTDIDVANVLHTGDLIRHGDYMPSRTPGVPVFEAIATVLDPVGGHLLLNLATLTAGIATIVGLARLVRAWGHENDDLLALALFASPITIIASTSSADFMWALAFFVWGAVLHLRDKPLPAGLLFALSIGSRLSSGFMVVAFLVADGWDPANRRRCLRSLAVAVPLGAATYIPSWLAFDRSTRFLHNTEGYRSFANNLGRFVYKNYAFAGPILLVVLLVAVPALLAALRNWRTDPMLRFAVLGFAVSEGLYFVMPWKEAHLLPSLFALLLWLGASARNRRGFLWLLIAALAVNGLFSLRLLSPDHPGEAGAGQWNPGLGAGFLVNDIRCRLDYMDQTPESYETEAWACTLKPMRGPVPPGADTLS